MADTSALDIAERRAAGRLWRDLADSMRHDPIIRGLVADLIDDRIRHAYGAALPPPPGDWPRRVTAALGRRYTLDPARPGINPPPRLPPELIDFYDRQAQRPAPAPRSTPPPPDPIRLGDPLARDARARLRSTDDLSRWMRDRQTLRDAHARRYAARRLPPATGGAAGQVAVPLVGGIAIGTLAAELTERLDQSWAQALLGAGAVTGGAAMGGAAAGPPGALIGAGGAVIGGAGSLAWNWRQEVTRGRARARDVARLQGPLLRRHLASSPALHDQPHTWAAAYPDVWTSLGDPDLQASWRWPPSENPAPALTTAARLLHGAAWQPPATHDELLRDVHTGLRAWSAPSTDLPDWSPGEFGGFLPRGEG